MGQVDQVRRLRWIAGSVAAPLLGPGVYWVAAPYLLDLHEGDSALMAVPYSYAASIVIGVPSVALLSTLRRLTAPNLITATTFAGLAGAFALLRFDLRDLVPLGIFGGYAVLTAISFSLIAGVRWSQPNTATAA